MAFEDLRERLKESTSEALAKIQENSTFNSMREKYESQTPVVQKVIAWGGAAFFVFLVVWMLPGSYLVSSSDSLARFEENRELIQGLLRASHSAKEPPPLPPPLSFDSLRSSIETSLRNNGLIGEQFGDMIQIPESELRGLAPGGVVVTGIAVTLKKLNVTQVIEIGNMVQNLNTPGNKMLGVDVLQSAGQTHYYDMIMRLVNFGREPFDAGPDPDAGKGGGKKPPPRKGKSGDAELEGE